jgi:hypothetical protein
MNALGVNTQRRHVYIERSSNNNRRNISVGITETYYRWIDQYIRSRNVPIEGYTREYYQKTFGDDFDNVEAIALAMVDRFGHENLRRECGAASCRRTREE